MPRFWQACGLWLQNLGNLAAKSSSRPCAQRLAPRNLSWFEWVFGFEELPYAATREQFRLEGTRLVVKATGKSFEVGPWECLAAQHLRQRLADAKEESNERLEAPASGLHFQHIVGDVTALHQDPDNADAVFQAASQFNALEMVGPDITPEHGITRYDEDRTQGPACALACPAATVFRNYFCMPGGLGQGGGQDAQLDLLSGVGALVDNPLHRYWQMRNGYCIPSSYDSLAALGRRLEEEEGLGDAVRDAVAVGIHWGTEVEGGRWRKKDGRWKVCQVYTAALPIAYCNTVSAPDHVWKPFATAVLDGLYDATLAAAAVLAAQKGTRVKVYLTAVGGGVFGNPTEWVAAAIQRAMEQYASEPLDVKLVHYGSMPALGPGQPWSTLAWP